MTATYRKKPVVIEAYALTHSNIEDVKRWCGGSYWSRPPMRAVTGLTIATLEGAMEASFGDFIICGVKGEFYPCKPDIFAATYEAVEPAAECCPRCGADLADSACTATECCVAERCTSCGKPAEANGTFECRCTGIPQPAAKGPIALPVMVRSYDDEEPCLYDADGHKCASAINWRIASAIAAALNQPSPAAQAEITEVLNRLDYMAERCRGVFLGMEPSNDGWAQWLDAAAAALRASGAGAQAEIRIHPMSARCPVCGEPAPFEIGRVTYCSERCAGEKS